MEHVLVWSELNVQRTLTMCLTIIVLVLAFFLIMAQPTPPSAP